MGLTANNEANKENIVKSKAFIAEKTKLWRTKLEKLNAKSEQIGVRTALLAKMRKSEQMAKELFAQCDEFQTSAESEFGQCQSMCHDTFKHVIAKWIAAKEAKTNKIKETEKKMRSVIEQNKQSKIETKRIEQRMERMKETLQTEKRNKFHNRHDIDELNKISKATKTKTVKMSNTINKLNKEKNGSMQVLEKMNKKNGEKE